MKKSVLLGLTLFISLMSYAQEINLLRNSMVVKKGMITYSNGVSEKFRNLQITGDNLTFKDVKGTAMEARSGDVFKVVKTGNYGLYGLFLGGASGLLGGLQGINDLNASGYDTSGSGPVLLGVTVGGAIFGGLMGLLFKREKTVFKNNSALSFSPGFVPLHNGEISTGLNIKLSLP